MKDGLNRSINYLRISLTDKCNYRCGYCMPPEGIPSLKHQEILTLEEIEHLCLIMTGLGVSKVRLTGGEPLVRKNVTGLVSKLRQNSALHEICMTTNGSRLSEYAPSLKEAGLDRINISLDTLNENTFRFLTGKDGLSDVLTGIHAALDASLPVHLNCVPLQGINDGEISSLVQFADSLKTDIRFIELMPIGCGRQFTGIPSARLISLLEKQYGKGERLPGQNGPAEYYQFNGLSCRVGMISPLSHQFCSACNRIRLTAEGFLKLCLQYPGGVDLKTPLRSGADDQELSSLIREAVLNKPASHLFLQEENKTDRRKMVQIGG